MARSVIRQARRERGDIPRETVGEEALGLGGTLEDPGSRTSRRALAPQLIRRANGLLGLPEASSVSSMALSSCAEDMDEIEETDPRLKEKLPGPWGGEPLTLDMLIRRWVLACAAAVVMGPG